MKREIGAAILFLAMAILLIATGNPSVSATSTFFDEAEMQQFLERNPRPFYAQGISAVETNMQNLSIEWFGLWRSEGFGGALVVNEGILIVVRPKGEVTWINLTKRQGPYATNISAPMNFDGLKASGLVESAGVDTDIFRAAGAFVERQHNQLRLYVSHHVFDEGCFFFQVSAIDLRFDGTAGLEPASEWKRVFRPEPCVHIGDASWKPFAGHQAGGRIVELDEKHLLVAYGDHEIDGERVGSHNAPQDMTSGYGKVWSVAKDGASADPYASGVRNPQGLFLASDGTVWLSEHGPKGGDELNRIVRGGNYGWPFQTYGVSYGDHPWPLNPRQGYHSDPRYRPPAFAWVPAIAPSNLTEVSGQKFALWQGDLLLATLKDQSIRRLRRQAGSIVYDERIEIGQRLRDIISLEDGRIAVVSDNHVLGILDDPGPKLREDAVEEATVASQISKDIELRTLGTKAATVSSYTDALMKRARALLQENAKLAVPYLEEAQRSGSPEAMLALAGLLAKGEAVDKDPVRAERLFTAVAKSGNFDEAWIGLADLYLENPSVGSPAAVATALNRALEFGHKRVRTRLGRMLIAGEGIARDDARARALLEGALADGDRREAAEALANLYAGSGATLEAAFDVYRVAVSEGSSAARLKLARLIMDHRTSVSDLGEAERLLNVEVEFGDRKQGFEALGDLYAKDSSYRDEQLAVRAYSAAAEAGSANASVKLAKLLLSPGPRQDVARAEQLLTRAENAGNKEPALKALAKLYSETGLKPNQRKRLVVLQRLVDIGDVQSMIDLGRIHAEGEGVQADAGIAESLFRKAGESGAARQAYYLLGELYESSAEKSAPAKAADAYRRAAVLGNVWAAIHLARMLTTDSGIPIDYAKARELLEESAKGSKDNAGPAWSALGDLLNDPNAPFYDPSQAAKAFARASDLGHGSAKVKLSVMLSDGTPTHNDLTEAERLLTEALSSNAKPLAAKALGDLLIKKDHTPAGLKRAQEFYETAAASGSGDAHLILGTFDFAKPRNEATRLMRLAHIRKAAELLNPVRVARHLMTALPSSELVELVQQMLTDVGSPVTIDGSFRQDTAEAAARFCNQHDIAGCAHPFVTQDLLVGLLSSRPT